ncbi:hypothetical protein BGW38_009004, partial [Lunasporangiospora selenospora]
MVRTTFILNGLEHLVPLHKSSYKKPKGFRFQFREAKKEHWEEFEESVSDELEDEEKLEKLGLEEWNEEEEVTETETLQNLDLNAAWNWYSKVVLRCAKETVPGRIVGRSGLKPGKEVSPRYVLHGVTKLHQLATKFRKSPRSNTPDETWEETRNRQSVVVEQVQEHNEKTTDDLLQ